VDRRAQRRLILGLLAALAFAVAALSWQGAARAATAGFPSKGKVVPGKSIGSITLGLTQAQVRAHWGHNYKVCTYCKLPTWLYIYPGGEPLGAAVKFGKTGKVVAVFTLGSPAGWGLKGLMMGDPVSNVYNLFGSTGTTHCIGYDALTVRIGQTTMSFYSSAGVIYGYALTASSESPCQ
jgi:hypothetical protein